MKAHEIEAGKVYLAKVNGRVVRVRVDDIRKVAGYGGMGSSMTRYDVTNLETGRRTTFRSAAKFREVAPAITGKEISEACPFTSASALARSEGSSEQCPDPTSAPTVGQMAATDVGVTTTSSDFPSVDQVTDPTIMAPTASEPMAGFAARIAPTPSITGRQLTDEQLELVARAPSCQVLVVEAGAGCGKTSSLVEVSNAMPGIGQYTAFNTSLVAESKTKFPSRVRCNTIHSLAFSAEGKKHQHRLGGRRVQAADVAAMIGLDDVTIDKPDGGKKVLNAGLLASQAIRALRNFCQSADREVEPKHVPKFVGIDAENSQANSDRLREHLLPYARKLWDGKCDPNGQVPFCHDDYVKMWQLRDPHIVADYILLDEAQDTSPVMLAIMEAQVRHGTRVILVGDSAQQIYSWRGAVNALAAFPDAPRLMLSLSFRFGQVVAEVANAILSHLSERTPLVMRGLDRIKSRLDRIDAPDCILCRSNAGAVSHLLDAIGRGKRPHLIGNGDDVVSFCRAAQELQRGRSTQHPELFCFSSWGEVKAYAKTDEGEDLRLIVKLIDQFGVARIISALERMPQERDADLVISTAHKSKGREWKQVKLASDFPSLEKMDDEAVRLLYVAATRAQLVIDVEECPPFCGSQMCDNDGQHEGSGEQRTVDIGAARKLSQDIKQAARVEVADVPAISAPAPIPAAPEPPAAPLAIAPFPDAAGGILSPGNGIPAAAAPTNTWARGRHNDWVVRGRPGQVGTVTVVRKNGTTSRETIKRVIWQNEEVALYEV